MLLISPTTRTLASCVLAFTLTGCVAPQNDLVRIGQITVQREQSELIDVLMPSVSRDGDSMVVSGRLLRRTQDMGPLPGHLDITVLSPEGRMLNESRAHWFPVSVPLHGPRDASYIVRFHWLPPDGSVVRIVHRIN